MMQGTRLVVGAAAAAALLVAGPSGTQAQMANPDSVQIRSERVGDGVYVLYGDGGNIGVAVGDDAVFVIDDQWAPLTPKIQAAIGKLSNKPVRFVLNTHWHGDHTGGNENFGKGGALIVAHDNVRRRLATDQVIEFFKIEAPASPEGALPVITFSDTVTFHINGDEVVAFHTPAAHTDGDAVVFFRKANVVHMGDMYVQYGYPFVDLSSGGSLSGLIRGVERVLAMIDDRTKVIPGHGTTADKAAVREFHRMMVTIRDRVQREVAAGKSLEQIIAAKPTAEFDAKWGKGFVKPADFLRVAHQDAMRR